MAQPTYEELQAELRARKIAEQKMAEEIQRLKMQGKTPDAAPSAEIKALAEKKVESNSFFTKVAGYNRTGKMVAILDKDGKYRVYHVKRQKKDEKGEYVDITPRLVPNHANTFDGTTWDTPGFHKKGVAEGED